MTTILYGARLLRIRQDDYHEASCILGSQSTSINTIPTGILEFLAAQTAAVASINKLKRCVLDDNGREMITNIRVIGVYLRYPIPELYEESGTRMIGVIM